MTANENERATAEAVTPPVAPEQRVSTAPSAFPKYNPRADALLDALREVDENATDGTPYALTYLVAE